VSGRLNHSPAAVLRQALVDLGVASDPGTGQEWPAFATKEPDAPENALTL
jgi:hypothetical protein